MKSVTYNFGLVKKNDEELRETLRQLAEGGVQRLNLNNGLLEHFIVTPDAVPKYEKAMKEYGLSFMDAQRKINDDFRLGLPIDGADKKALKEAEKRAADRRRAIEADRRVREALKSAYDKALAWYGRLDAIRTKYAPKNENEGFNDAYAFALHEISIAEYELERAETNLYLYEHSGRQL